MLRPANHIALRPFGRAAAIYSAALLALLSVASFSDPAAAQAKARTLKEYKNWSVHAPQDSAIRMCFAATGPVKGKTKTSQPIKSRGEAQLVVANFPERGLKEQVAVALGFTANASKPVTLKVDDKVFKMFVDGEDAWLDSPADDAKAVAAMRAGSKAWVTATSRRGTRITDEYSLIGFTNATKDIAARCK